MKTILLISAILFLSFLFGMVFRIIFTCHRNKKNEIEGESFRVDCSEKKEGE